MSINIILDLKTETAMPFGRAVKTVARLARIKSDIPRLIKGAPRGWKCRAVDAAKALWEIQNASDPLDVPIQQRLRQRLVTLTMREIELRNLSTPAGLGETFHLQISDYDPVRRLWVAHGDGWYEYSRRVGSYRQTASYLTGHEDGQYWAVRVPGTITLIIEALEWLTPGPVRRALEHGKPVRRQGDIYFVGSTRGKDDFSALFDTRHACRSRMNGGWTVVHPEHKPVRLSGKYHWKCYRQTQINGIGRAFGD